MKINDILYIEGLKEYVTYITRQRKFVVLESLHRLEEILPSNFIRVHKSYIINTDHIIALNGNQIELENTRIPIGKTYTDQVKGRLFGWNIGYCLFLLVNGVNKFLSLFTK